MALKASVVEDDLAKLGLHFTAHDRKGRKRVMIDAYRAGEVVGRKFVAQGMLA